LDLPNRSHDEYRHLGERLVGAATDAGHEVRQYGGSVDSCWHWHLSVGAELPIGNPCKDTRAFHAVQHQKTAWVVEAANETNADIMVWMDYGLLHVPGITPDMIPEFLERAAASAWRRSGDRRGTSPIGEMSGGGVRVACSPCRGRWRFVGMTRSSTGQRRCGPRAASRGR
jgi:hypothetical protein